MARLDFTKRFKDGSIWNTSIMIWIIIKTMISDIVNLQV
jgi:hypothetical protein